MVLAYIIGALCMITVLLLTIIRFTESKNKKDIPLINKDAESPEQVSAVSMSTAHSLPPPPSPSLHVTTKHNTIKLSPQVSQSHKANHFHFINFIR